MRQGNPPGKTHVFNMFIENRFFLIILKLRAPMVFLMKYSDSTHKVTSIWKLLGWYDVFRWCCHQDPIFGERHDFAFHEQQNWLRAKLTTGSKIHSRKYPHLRGFLFFFWYSQTHYCMSATPFVSLCTFAAKFIARSFCWELLLSCTLNLFRSLIQLWHETG